jgi:hypothetical protein
MPKSKHNKNVAAELKTPNSDPEFATAYSQFATRILWMDKNVVPGAFQMNCSWYLKPTMHAAEVHKHDVDEIIGFFGNDSTDPYNLHGEIEMWLEGQKFLLTKSTMLFVPAGMNHCPLTIRRVDKPIFHFSVVTSNTYTQQKADVKAGDNTGYDKYVVQTLQEPE